MDRTKHKSINEYDSMWNWTRDRSTYHFDKWRQESPSEYFRVLGNLTPT